MSEHRRHILVIGGGAAGMAAALAAARAGCRVRKKKKNEKLGKKLFITGKGRCNVTNACPVEELFDGVVTNSRFLYSSIYGFSNQDLMNLLEDGGLRLKVERGNRVFPQSDKSSDVIRTWERLLRQAGVEIHLNAPVKGIWMEDGRCRGIIAGDGPRGGLPGGGSSGGSGGADIEALARAVIRGEYGNGEERRRRLGSLYDAVQARVNEILL